ncbi:MAG: hypothetical protein AAB356_09245, partial [Deltaproteobacteria bacterium]
MRLSKDLRSVLRMRKSALIKVRSSVFLPAISKIASTFDRKEDNPSPKVRKSECNCFRITANSRSLEKEDSDFPDSFFITRAMLNRTDNPINNYLKSRQPGALKETSARGRPGHQPASSPVVTPWLAAVSAILAGIRLDAAKLKTQADFAQASAMPPVLFYLETSLIKVEQYACQDIGLALYEATGMKNWMVETLLLLSSQERIVWIKDETREAARTAIKEIIERFRGLEDLFFDSPYDLPPRDDSPQGRDVTSSPAQPQDRGQKWVKEWAEGLRQRDQTTWEKLERLFKETLAQVMREESDSVPEQAQAVLKASRYPLETALAYYEEDILRTKERTVWTHLVRGHFMLAPAVLSLLTGAGYFEARRKSSSSPLVKSGAAPPRRGPSASPRGERASSPVRSRDESLVDVPQERIKSYDLIKA